MKRVFLQFAMKIRVRIFVVVLLVGASLSYGQSSGYGNIGVGGGLSYGGLGARITYIPIEKLGLFGSLGYNLDAVGYNLGVQFHVPFQKKLSFYITGMYGYNTVLIVDAGAMESKTTYYGFSAGVGVEFKLKEKSFLSSEILVPFRTDDYKDAVDDLESIGLKINDPLPLTFSFGYHFKF